MTTDTAFNHVALLMHMDGADDGTTFTDVLGKTMTRTGTPVTKTGVKKYGTASCYCNGTAENTLRFAPGSSMDMGGNLDFTIEAWVYLNALPGHLQSWYFLGSTNTPYPDWVFRLYTASGSNYLGLYYTNSGGAWNDVLSSAVSLSTSAWHHIAVCRSGNTLRFFADGVKVGSDIAFSATFRAATTANWKIGNGDGSWPNWYLDDLRVTIGTARYTANFTPPSEAFPDSAPDQVVLLMHMDGSDNGTAFTDVKGHSVSRSGVVTKTGTAKYGTASALFTHANGDYLQLNRAPEFNFQALDFTIEFWQYKLSSSGYNVYYDARLSGGDDGFYLDDNSSSTALRVLYQNTPVITAAAAITLDSWHHVAVVRSGATLTLYVDGVSKGTYNLGANTVGCNAGTWRIGNSATGTGIGFNGYIDDFRITKGKAQYLANFTPPSGPFADSAAVFADFLASLRWALAAPHIAGTITESLDIADWRIRAHRLDTGALVGEVDVSAAAYDLGVTSLAPVMVSCMPKIGGIWTAGAAHSSGDYIVPSDPVATPYVYRCTSGGTSHASTEPAWGTTPGGTTSDGTVVWTCQGRLAQPILHGPLIP